MNAIALDTLKLACALRDKAKLAPEQAEGFADALAEALQGDLATKSDVEAVRADLRQAELRLQRQIEASKAKILKWMSGTVGVQTLALLGAALAFARMVRP